MSDRVKKYQVLTNKPELTDQEMSELETLDAEGWSDEEMNLLAGGGASVSRPPESIASPEVSAHLRRPPEKKYSYLEDLENRLAREQNPDLQERLLKAVQEERAIERQKQKALQDARDWDRVESEQMARIKPVEKPIETGMAVLSGASVVAPETLGVLTGDVGLDEYKDLQVGRQKLEAEHPYASFAGAVLSPSALGKLAATYKVGGWLAKNPRVAQALMQGGAGAAEAFMSSFSRGASLEDSLKAAGLGATFAGATGSGKAGGLLAGAGQAGLGEYDYQQQMDSVKNSDLSPAEKAKAEKMLQDQRVVTWLSGGMTAGRSAASMASNKAAEHEQKKLGELSQSLAEDPSILAEHRRQKAAEVAQEYIPQEAELNVKKLEQSLQQAQQKADVSEKLVEQTGLESRKQSEVAEKILEHYGIESKKEAGLAEQIISKQAELADLGSEKVNTAVDELVKIQNELTQTKREILQLKSQVVSGAPQKKTIEEKAALKQARLKHLKLKQEESVRNVAGAIAKDVGDTAAKREMMVPGYGKKMMELATEGDDPLLSKNELTPEAEIEHARRRKESAKASKRREKQIIIDKEQRELDALLQAAETTKTLSPEAKRLQELKDKLLVLQGKEKETTLGMRQKPAIDPELTALRQQKEALKAQSPELVELLKQKEALKATSPELENLLKQKEALKVPQTADVEKDLLRLKEARALREKQASISIPTETELAPQVERAVRDAGYDFSVPIGGFLKLAGLLGGQQKTTAQDKATSVKRARLMQAFVGAPNSTRQKLLEALDPSKGGSTARAFGYLLQDPETEEFRRILKEQ